MVMKRAVSFSPLVGPSADALRLLRGTVRLDKQVYQQVKPSLQLSGIIAIFLCCEDVSSWRRQLIIGKTRNATVEGGEAMFCYSMHGMLQLNGRLEPILAGLASL